MTTYDAIILGAGHNGLILQAYLGKAGLKTVAVERRAVAGGGLSTLEDARGFLHNTHAFILRAVTAMPWYADLEREIARAGEKVLAYHVNDWLVPTSDLLLDRGMMGDGVIDLRAIRARVEAAGYRGHCEVEILSANNWWKRDPDEVVRICIERHQTVV